MDNIIRTVRLRLYVSGMGPTFTLIMRDSGRTDDRGCTRISYTLQQHTRVRKSGRLTATIFDGTDFCPSPGNGDDSNASVAGLLGFLTLRPGDTDAEYFADYTHGQLEFASQHAEALACYAIDRFGES